MTVVLPLFFFAASQHHPLLQRGIIATSYGNEATTDGAFR
jgi:hypothetical protein